MNLINVTIKTLSPVVLTGAGSSRIVTSCNDSFSGTVLRGVLAGKYIQNKQLKEHAERDKEFCRFFFEKLRFAQANPLVQGHRAAVLPLSLMKAKDKNAAHPIMDLLQDAPAAGYKGLKGMAWIADNMIHPVAVHSSMGFHMSRSAESERLGGHSQDGKVFTYESIDAHQVFRGAIIGEKEDLQDFLRTFETNQFVTRLGRSKYTQYGQCEISFSDIQNLPDISLGEHVFLILDTPLIPDFGDATKADAALQCIVDEMNRLAESDDFYLGAVYGASQSIENFVGVWEMYRPQQQALAAGTVFELCKKSAWTDADKQNLQLCLYGGVGSRREEGFGQVRLWNHKSLALVSEQEGTQKKAKAYAIQSGEVKKVVWHILEKRLAEQLQIQAFEDVNQLDFGAKESVTHTFARLESWLGNRNETEHIRDRFYKRIHSDVRNGSPMQNHLQHLRFQKKQLLDILSGSASMPFERPESLKALENAIPPALAEEVDFKILEDNKLQDIMFYEYWLWFFRHGRKQAVQKNRESEAD